MPKKVLLIDYRPEVADSRAHSLRKKGYLVDVSRNPADHEHMTRDGGFDAVVYTADLGEDVSSILTQIRVALPAARIIVYSSLGVLQMHREWIERANAIALPFVKTTDQIASVL